MTCLRRKYVNLLVAAVVLLGTLVGLVIVSVVKWNTRQPTVKTKLGVIRGLIATNGDYAMYLGIPYATVDRNNPFGLSIPFPKFEGIYDANSDADVCPQREDYNHTLAGSLDCLKLNVYVPNVASKQNPLPVLVFIQGGRNEVGFNKRIIYGPTFLMKQDIILVVSNFRLGPYGFMCLDTPEVAGNQGLKDQLNMLRWVKENIKEFNGDPKRITLAGASAGGIHVTLHFMRVKEPLFQQVIIQGGSKAYPLIMSDPDVTVPLRIAEHLGYTTKDTHKALKFLATKDPLAVVNSSLSLNIQYKACVENEFDNVESFITRHMSNIKYIPSIRNMSILVGQSTNEMLYQYAKIDFDNSNKDVFRKVLDSLFDFDEKRLQSMEEYVKHFYIGNQEVSNKVKKNIIDFASDAVHHYQTKMNNRKFMENDVKKLYFYVFSYTGDRNMVRLEYKINASCPGATHNDEQGYLFDPVSMADRHSPPDEFMIDRVATIWGNFVKYGDPTPKTSELLPVKWKPITKESLNYYKIDTNVSMSTDPFQYRLAFWDMLYKLNGKFLRKPTRH